MASMKKARPKQCRICGEQFMPWSTTQVICRNFDCAVAIAKTKREAAFKKETTRKRSAFRDGDKTFQIQKAQTACNAYIRHRDRLDGCISCDKPATWQGQWHASHYRPHGNCSPLRFHEMNIHKSCSECNNFKSGNLAQYRISLINKIGLQSVEWLESHNEPHRWDIDDLKLIIIYYKEKCAIDKPLEIVD